MSRITRPRQPAARIEPMEPRILYSADPAGAVLASEISQALIQTLAPPGASPDVLASGTGAGVDPAHQASGASVRIDPDNQDNRVAQIAGRRELVVIDNRVDALDELLADLDRQQAEGRALDVLVLAAGDDGIDVLTRSLADQPGRFDAIHLIGHGEFGRAQLGATSLDLDTLRSQADKIARWGEALRINADLLVYGCDVAADTQGEQLLDSLAALTGADVTGSADKTGASLRGGDWALEYGTGPIESALVVSGDMQQHWDVLLGPTVITGGAEILVNSTTSGQQNTPAGAAARQIAMNPSGQSVVVWREHSSGGVIQARLFDAAGNPTSAPIVVSTHTASQEEPSVAIDGSGRFVVVWTEGDNQDGDGKGVFGRVFDPTGNPATAVFLVNQVTELDSWAPVVAINPQAASSIDFYVTFTRRFVSGNSNGVQARAFQWDGSPVNNEFDVNVTGNNHQQNSSLAFAADGSALIVWQSMAQDGSGWGIYGQRLDAAGAPTGPEFAVHTSTAGDQTNPDVSADSNNNFVVAWTHDTGGVQGLNIMAQRLDPVGAMLGGEFVVSQHTADDQSDVSISATDSGHFMMVWQSHSQDAAGGWGIYARQFGSDGVARGSEIRVNATLAGDQVAPTIAYSGERAVVAWSGRSDQSLPPDNDGVFLQRLSVPASGLAMTVSGAANEAGASSLLSVALEAEPVADVVLTLQASDPTEAALSTTVLTFTPGNWNVSQVVLVTGRDDRTIDGDKSLSIDVTVTSADIDYSGLTEVSPIITNADNDLRNEIVVTTNSDVVDGDVSSLAALEDNSGSDGRVSTREALLAANATANGPGGSDLIRFDLSSAAGRTILLSSALPYISDTVELDATTDPAYSSHPVVGLERQGLATFDGLKLVSGSAGSVIRGLQVGGFFGAGIVVESAGNLIEQNYVGTDLTGASALGNQGDGIVLRNGSASTIVRSNRLAASITGNGISLEAASDTVVRANHIGVSASGAPLGNGGSGIFAHSGANSNLIESNTIGGNGSAGIRISASNNNVVWGNGIGTSVSNGVDLGNQGHGVQLENGASGNLVGGAGPGQGNRIQFNDGRAIVVADFLGASQSNPLLGNLIDHNGYGIDLETSSVTYSALPTANSNDPLDADTGPNALQNAPVLDAVVAGLSNTTVYGSLDSTPGTWFRVELFADASAELNGLWQASMFIGHLDVLTDSTGHADFAKTVTHTPAAGSRFSATATRSDLTHLNFFDTSESSAAVAVNSQPVWASPLAFTVTENETLVGTLLATDADLPAQVLNWTIVGGTDNNRLLIESATGRLSFVLAPDFESPQDTDANGIYEVLVRVSDGYQSVTELLRVSVANSNESPSVRSGSLELAAGSQQTLGRATLEASDIDSGTAELVYEVTRSSALGVLRLDSIELQTGARFSQADVDQGRVRYEALAGSSGEDTIELSLTDGAGQLAVATILQVKVLAAAADAPAAPTAPAAVVGHHHGTSTSTAAPAPGDTAALPLPASAAVAASTPPAVAVSTPPPAVAGNESPAAVGRTSARGAAPSALAAAAAGGDVAARELSVTRSDVRDREFTESTRTVNSAGSFAELSRRMGLSDLNRRDALVSAAPVNSTVETGDTSWLRSATHRAELREELDRVRQTLDQRLVFDRNMVASSATVSASVSIGYVIWLLRGGVLLSSLLAAMPAWVALDPLPILSRASNHDDDDDESLQDILQKARQGDAQNDAFDHQGTDSIASSPEHPAMAANMGVPRMSGHVAGQGAAATPVL